MFTYSSLLKSSIWRSGTKIAVYQIRQNTFNSNSTLVSREIRTSFSKWEVPCNTKLLQDLAKICRYFLHCVFTPKNLKILHFRIYCKYCMQQKIRKAKTRGTCHYLIRLNRVVKKGFDTPLPFWLRIKHALKCVQLRMSAHKRTKMHLSTHMYGCVCARLCVHFIRS